MSAMIIMRTNELPFRFSFFTSSLSLKRSRRNSFCSLLRPISQSGWSTAEHFSKISEEKNKRRNREWTFGQDLLIAVSDESEQDYWFFVISTKPITFSLLSWSKTKARRKTFAQAKEDEIGENEHHSNEYHRWRSSSTLTWENRLE